MKASSGVLYELFDQFTREYGEAILHAWSDIYHIADDEMESLEELSCSDLLSLACDVAEEVEHAKEVA